MENDGGEDLLHCQEKKNNNKTKNKTTQKGVLCINFFGTK